MLGFAAVNTGNNLLYLLVSALLGFMAVSGVLGKWNLSRIEVRYVLPEEVYAGIPTLLGIALTNRRRWLPIFLMEVHVENHSRLFTVIEPGQSRQKSVEASLSRRGRQPLPPLVLRSRFPVNFFIRSQGVPVRQEITVFPAPLPCPDLQQPDPGSGHGTQQN